MRPEADRYRVDTVLLSCRVLGRGVEHALLSHLGQRAVRNTKRFVELGYRPRKNAPVREFNAELGDQAVSETGHVLDLRRGLPGEPRVQPGRNGAARAGGAGATRPGPTPVSIQDGGFEGADRSEPAQRIAESLCDIERLARAIEAYRLRNGPLDAPVDVAPASTLQATLLNIWKKGPRTAARRGKRQLLRGGRHVR